MPFHQKTPYSCQILTFIFSTDRPAHQLSVCTGEGVSIWRPRHAAVVIRLHLHKLLVHTGVGTFAASPLPQCYQAQHPPCASVPPGSCVAKAIAGLASTQQIFFPSKSPTFCHFTPGDRPVFPDSQSQDGPGWLCPPKVEHGWAGVRTGLSPWALAIKANDCVTYCHYLCCWGRQMGLIKPLVPARDIYYKAGAILPFPSLPWIQLGLKAPRRHVERLTPNLFLASHRLFSTGIPWEMDMKHRLFPEMQPYQTQSLGIKAEKCTTLFQLFSGRFFLLLEALTKILGGQDEIQQQPIIPLPRLDPFRAFPAVAAAFLGWRSNGSSHAPHNSPR